MSIFRGISVAVLVSLVALEGLATPQVTAKKGWWNYHFVTPPKKEKPKPPTNQPAGATTSAQNAPSQLSRKALWSMHPDRFQKHLNQAQKWAVKTLKPKDVAYYRKVQDVARRKATAYAAVSSYVAEQDPQSQRFDLVSPMNTPGRNAVQRQQKQELDQLLRSKAGSYGLVYFKSQTCALCRAQDGIMNYFRRDFPQWDIDEVDIAQRPDLAGLFGVEKTPTLALLQQDNGKPELLSVGVLSLSALKTRLYRRIRVREGLVEPQRYFMLENQRGGALDPLAGEK